MPNTIAVANTRLRLYDSRCTRKPSSFPANEVFGGAGALCSSVDLASTANGIIGMQNSQGRSYFGVITHNLTRLRIYEARLTFVAGQRLIEPVLIRSITTSSIIGGMAFTPVNDLLAFTLTEGKVGTLRVNGNFASDSHPLQEVARPRLALGAVAWSPDGQALVINNGAKSAKVLVVPLASPTEFARSRSAEASFAAEPGDEADALSIVTGQFNDDSLWDIALIANSGRKLRFIRQQPPPCATFITAAAHGMITAPNVYEELARFNRLLDDEVAKVNAARRPGLNFRGDPSSIDAICPSRFIDVRGHWEDRTALGVAPLATSRGAWLGSMLVPTPLCWGVTPPMLPASNPEGYWASAFFLLVNGIFEPLHCVPDIPLISDPFTRLRFLGAGLGAGAEKVARDETSPAARRTARDLEALLDQAVIDADAGGDNPCTHKIFIDLIGHSRGGSMVQRTIALAANRPASVVDRWKYNLEISHTILDGIDPSPEDTWRPFARAGFLVDDPVIERQGSEWLSAFYGSNSADGSPLDSFLWLVPPYVGPEEFRRSSVVGMPTGRDRQAELDDPLRTFNVFQGPVSSLRHRDFAGDPIIQGDVAVSAGVGLMWVDPAAADPSDVSANHLRQPSGTVAPLAPLFAFVNTSHLGSLLQNPRGSIPDARGFFDHLPTPAEEQACMPSTCSTPTTVCSPPPEPPPTSCNAPRSKPWIHCDNDRVAARELVSDFDLRASAGVVENAKQIVTIDPEVKQLIPGADFEEERSFILTTASTEFPEGGAWRRTGDVKLKSKHSSISTVMAPYLGYPNIDFAPADGAAAEQGVEALKTALFANGDGADAIALLAAAAARLDATDTPVYADYGQDGTLWAPLREPSLAYDSFFVRVEYELESTAGGLSIALDGPNLDESALFDASAGLGVRVAELTMQRTAPARTGFDEVIIKGSHVAVYSISVRTSEPLLLPDGMYYEYVVLEDGVTHTTAEQLAQRSVYQGKSGQLASDLTSSLLSIMTTSFYAETPAWVAAKSENGAAGSFNWASGSPVDSSAWRSGTSFAEERPLGANAFTWPSTDGTKLGHSGPAVSLAGARFGFWIQYPAASAQRLAAETAEESTAFTDGAETADEGACAEGCSMATDEATPRGAGPPVCRRADLTCLER